VTDSREFYDGYVERQVSVGENARHHAILAGLRRAGLREHDHVLEIGCGVGTFTRLLASDLRSGGSVVASDISPKSIDAARERLAGMSNVRLITGDILTVPIEGSFDVVVLPDVIEHIPVERHRDLFGRVAGWLAGAGFALLNYPNPHYLEWCQVHTPELLQAIDQPVHADVLLANVYPSGLYLDFMETYSIWVREGDYVQAVLRPRAAVNSFTELPEPRPSLISRAIHRVRGHGG
jgi:SAM-dependent methyltransferase